MRSGGGTTDYKQIADGFLPRDIADQLPDAVCERLAKTHYENFPVGSILMPKRLKRHIFNIYAYCRVCDDLGDETGDPELSLKLLSWWREELRSCYAGKPRHQVFVALHETIQEFDLPMQPFEDLISAFEQDQTVARYNTFDSLLGYCERSANPVGRLFLYVLGYRDEPRQLLSDCTCTALQLVNFWQDIGVDYGKGRIYIPQEDMQSFGYTEYELANRVVNPAFMAMMRFEAERTRKLFERGAGLCGMISGVGAADVELFTSCGVALLNSIEKHNYDVLRKRISVSQYTKTTLVLKWVARHLFSAGGGQ